MALHPSPTDAASVQALCEIVVASGDAQNRKRAEFVIRRALEAAHEDRNERFAARFAAASGLFQTYAK